MVLVMALMLIGSAVFFLVLALVTLRAEKRAAAPAPTDTDSVPGLRTFAGPARTAGEAALRDASGREGTVRRAVSPSRN